MNTQSVRLPLLAAAVLLGVGALPAIAQDTGMGDTAMINPAGMKWSDAPPTLPKGAKLAVLYGDPGKDGPFVIRIKAPAGYRVPPHWHTIRNPDRDLRHALSGRRRCNGHGCSARAQDRRFPLPAGRRASLCVHQDGDGGADQQHGAAGYPLRRSEG